ncbi:MAG: hypothetical protein JST46_00700 [Bacteroidetes bacterium]|nr:hypothetical protein [Bacteroidota bacterium]
MNLIGIISSVILIQLVLLSAFLFTSGQGKKLSNRILACFFIWMALNIIDGLLTYSGFYTDHPALAHWEDGLVLLVGPLLYFYTQSVVYKDFSFSSRDLLHLAPFVTILFQLIYHYQTADYQKMIEAAVAYQTLPTGYYLAITVVYAQITLYFVLSFKVFIRVSHKNQGSLFHGHKSEFGLAQPLCSVPCWSYLPTAYLPLNGTKTLYVLLGDFVVYACAFALTAIAALSYLASPRKEPASLISA